MENPIQEQAKHLLDLESQLSSIEKQLDQVELFHRYVDTKKQLDSFRAAFNENAIKFLKENDLKTSEGPAGKITLVQRLNVRIDDESQIPEDLMIRVPDTKTIRENYKRFNVLAPGARIEMTESIRYTPPKNKELPDAI